jgi:hypothetical protein
MVVPLHLSYLIQQDITGISFSTKAAAVSWCRARGKCLMVVRATGSRTTACLQQNGGE